MTPISPLAYVTKADDLEVRIKIISSVAEIDILKLGFSYDSSQSEYFFTVTGDDEKAKIFSTLRDCDVYFSSGKEWSPAEVFEYLRGQGKLLGHYKRISWVSPTEFRIVES